MLDVYKRQALNSVFAKKVQICEMRREWGHSRHGSVFNRLVPEPTSAVFLVDINMSPGETNSLF